MNIQEILTSLGTGGVGAVIFLILTLVEITPIKVNPWSHLLKWIGDKMNDDLRQEFKTLKGELHTLKKDFEEKNAHDKRWSILDFANSCHNGRKHTKEEWEHVLNQLLFYEEYVDKNEIPNAVIEEETRYLRELYRELMNKNEFI